MRVERGLVYVLAKKACFEADNGECRGTSDDEEARDAAVIKALIKQILKSLRRLHRMGIVHRDVKPVRPKSFLMVRSKDKETNTKRTIHSLKNSNLTRCKTHPSDRHCKNR